MLHFKQTGKLSATIQEQANGETGHHAGTGEQYLHLGWETTYFNSQMQEDMMKKLIFLPLLLLISCSYSHNKARTQSPEVVYLTVNNTLKSSARIYLSTQFRSQRYLGSVKKGEKKVLLVTGAFRGQGFRLIAKPNSGRAIMASIPEVLSPGKKLVWELNRQRLNWAVNR